MSRPTPPTTPPAAPSSGRKGPEVLVLQHITCESPGTISDALRRAGVGSRFIGTWKDPVPVTPPEGIAGIVIMGGPMGVYEADKFPYLSHEMKLIESAVKQEIPVLGVCLGAQLMAAALGARVTPGPQKEIGWYPVQLDAGASDDPIFRQFPPEFMVFHWHGDRFELPRGALKLAHSEITPNQAFRYGESAYALQFHLEVNREQVGVMAKVFADELRAEKIADDVIVGISGAYLPAMEAIGRTVFDGWTELVMQRHRTR